MIPCIVAVVLVVLVGLVVLAKARALRRQCAEEEKLSASQTRHR